MAAANEFQVAIVTPEALVLETRTTEVQFPAFDGLVGVLNMRAPLLTKLGTGFITLKSSDGIQRFLISGGYGQMKDNVLTILTNEAIPADKLTAEKTAELTAKGKVEQNRTFDAMAESQATAAKRGN